VWARRGQEAARTEAALPWAWQGGAGTSDVEKAGKSRRFFPHSGKISTSSQHSRLFHLFPLDFFMSVNEQGNRIRPTRAHSQLLGGGGLLAIYPGRRSPTRFALAIIGRPYGLQ